MRSPTTSRLISRLASGWRDERRFGRQRGGRLGLSEVFRDLYLAAEHWGSPPPPQPLELGPRSVHDYPPPT